MLDAAWVLVFFLAAATAYAFFQVPFVAMPAEMTTSYDERTRLMTWRVAILAFTIMLAGATAPMIRDAVGGRDGYRVMGVVMAVLIMTGCVMRLPRHRPRHPSARSSRARARLRDQLRIVAADHDFRNLLTTFVIQALATGSHARGRQLPGREGARRQGLPPRSCSSASSPRRSSSPPSGRRWVGGGARSVATWSLRWCSPRERRSLVSARVAPPVVVFAATTLVGVGYAGCQVFPLAMLPDAAAVDARRSGSGRAGVYTGVWTAAETLGLALGPAIYGQVIALGGYRSSTTGDVAQPDSALNAIVVGFSVLPAVLTVRQPVVAAALLPRGQEVDR